MNAWLPALFLGLFLAACGKTPGQTTASPVSSTPRKSVVEERDKYTVRIGDLQVTAVAAGTVSPTLARRYGMQLGNSHHFVVVYLRLKNVSTHPNCTFLSGSLSVDAGYHYPSERFGTLPPITDTKMLPTDERRGAYWFRVNDGISPAKLTLVDNHEGEDLSRACSQWEPAYSGPTTASIPLEGLPRPVVRER